jgi:hypothetical protein
MFERPPHTNITTNSSSNDMMKVVPAYRMPQKAKKDEPARRNVPFNPQNV